MFSNHHICGKARLKRPPKHGAWKPSHLGSGFGGHHWTREFYPCFEPLTAKVTKPILRPQTPAMPNKKTSHGSNFGNFFQALQRVLPGILHRSHTVQETFKLQEQQEHGYDWLWKAIVVFRSGMIYIHGGISRSVVFVSNWLPRSPVVCYHYPIRMVV